MANQVSGLPKYDKKWWYPDLTGFQFDVKPCNVAYGRGSENLGSDEKYYGASYINLPWNNDEKCSYFDSEEHKVTDYYGWMNWIHKFQPDPRFLAISDDNAYLNQFPEVMTPWKFTEYIYKGNGTGYEIIEPPLFSPKTLKVINGVKNPDGFVTGVNEHLRREGKLSGDYYDTDKNEYGYYYYCKYNKSSKYEDIINGIENPGPRRKQFESDPKRRAQVGDLETGLVITTTDKNGKKTTKRYPPWYDPEAYPGYNSTFVNTKEICSVRLNYRYKSTNRGYKFDKKLGKYVSSGVRLYRKDIPVHCVDIGNHGNIPQNVINMTAPANWFDPSSTYRNVMVPVVTYEAGEAMYAENDGILYTNTLESSPEVKIETVSVSGERTETINGHTLRYLTISGTGDKIEQPRPVLGSKFHRMTKATLPSGVNNGDFIHRGCVNFSGNITTGCYCKVRKELFESGQDSDSGLITESIQYCTSHTASEGLSPIGKLCKFYVENGPKEIVIFDANQMTTDQYNQMMGYDKNSWVNLDPMGSFGIYGAYTGALLPKNLMASGTLNTGVSGLTARRKVTYEFQRISSTGRKVESKRAQQASMAKDYEYIVPGTGLFAFDTQDTGYGGVDNNIFVGSNLMSRHRFCNNVMGCYEPSKCSRYQGQLESSDGNLDGTFSGVGDESSYCRYYSLDCPSMGVNQRAFEYDREYKKLLNEVLYIFRDFGIDGFTGLNEVKIADGVYAAIGFNADLSSLMTVTTKLGAKCFFFYDITKDDPKHKKARVFGFIRQYGKAPLGGKLDVNSYLKMNCEVPEKDASGNDLFESGTRFPWLVEMYDDYVSPTKFESYATNLMPFIGGRSPEYKDYSKMGSEVLCTVTKTELGYDGMLSGGKGGDDEYKDEQESKNYIGYRIDKTGEYIIENKDDVTDGVSIGEDLTIDSVDMRGVLPPGAYNGAIPIFGLFKNQVINSEKAIRARMTQGWVYSSDTRDLINDINEIGISITGDDEGETVTIKVADFAHLCLPKEREFYYCPRCCPKPYSYMTYNKSYANEQKFYANSDSENYILDETKNIYNEPLFYQVFTDWEAQHYEYKCPRCAFLSVQTPLVSGGTWRYFPKCRAQGIVNYFGMPGEIVDKSGYFWKNHTEISRSFISEIRSKLGSESKIGGGYVLREGSSADQELESNVFHPRQYGSNIISGYHSAEDIAEKKASSGAEAQYTITDTRIPEDIGDYRHLSNNEQLNFNYDSSGNIVSGKYKDRFANPYRLLKDGKVADGLDFVSYQVFANLRNLVEPICGYPCYKVAEYDEFITEKQEGHKKRFSYVSKDIEDHLYGIDSFILADNDAHSDHNYVQYYDEDVGKALRAYYPSSPVWWYRHDYCGIIDRKGGTEIYHFDRQYLPNGELNTVGTNELHYCGNLKAASYNFLHGWLPLDKEVVGAMISFTVATYPEEPPLGRTRQGGKLFKYHWHSYNPKHKPMSDKASDGEREAAHVADDAAWLNAVMSGMSDELEAKSTTGNTGFDPNGYVPMLYNRSFFHNEDKNKIKTYVNSDFGTSISQNFITWSGFGTDIIQKVTEDSIWKELTFEEYQTEMNKFLMDLEFQVGGSEDKDKIVDTITICPPEIASGFSQNFGQAVTGYLNFTDMNSSYMINKFGMEMAEKVSNTSWAEGGQVIEQSNYIMANATTTNSSGGGIPRTYGSNTQNAADTSLGRTIYRDITSLVKAYYNDRILRGFKATGGVKYNEIWDYIKKNKVDIANGKTENLPMERINVRYKNDYFDGYLLSDCFRYPELNDNGEFPTIESGGEYNRKPEEMVKMSECGSFYTPFESTDLSDSNSIIDETDNEYWNYTPRVLFYCDEKGIPINGRFNNKLEFEKNDSNPASCLLYSYYEKELFFTVHISGFPTETERRPYRYTKGSWNTANAICPNPACFVHKDGKTVSEANVLSQTFVRPYSNCAFQSTSTKCGACRTDLTKGSTGAMYSGGDGLLTINYTHMPEKDCIINGFNIQIDQSSVQNQNCSFTVYSMASDEVYWNPLFTVEWLPKSRMWRYGVYSSGKINYVTSSTLPRFKGEWCDGYIPTDSLSNCHFIARKANKIKFVAIPRTKDETGEALTNNGFGARIYGPKSVSKTSLLESRVSVFVKKGLNIKDIERGCKFQLSKNLSFDESQIVFETEVQTYNSESGVLTFKTPIDIESLESDTYYYRIIVNRYSCDIKKFQIYGFEISEDYLKMTKNASYTLLPVGDKSPSVTYRDNISKFLAVSAVYGDIILYPMVEVDSMDKLFYYGKESLFENNIIKIKSGSFFFDTLTKTIYLPYLVKEEGTDLIYNCSIYDDTKVDQSTLPKALYVSVIYGAGESVDLPIVSIGEGPSYTIEKDCIVNIYNMGNKGEDSDFENIYKNDIEVPATLPNIGKSIYFRDIRTRYDMNWQVTNKKRVYYDRSFNWNGLRGTELCDVYNESGSSVDKDAFEKFLGGGGDETKNGLSTDIENDKGVVRILSGKVYGEITLTGLPNTIIGGVLYVYAPAKKIRTYNINGKQVKTYERTGGMRRTGFPFVPTKAQLKAKDLPAYLNCIALTKPKVVVYLRERLTTEEIG